MKHIRKRQWMGCAVATAAMLADRTYEEVAAHWPDLDVARTRDPGQLCALLEAVTDAEWHLAPCWYPQPRVLEFLPGPVPAAVWIQDTRIRPQFGQWVVINGEIVHDPGEVTTQLVNRYRFRDWVVTLVAKPGPSDELARIRERKQMQELRGKRADYSIRLGATRSQPIK